MKYLIVILFIPCIFSCTKKNTDTSAPNTDTIYSDSSKIKRYEYTGTLFDTVFQNNSRDTITSNKSSTVIVIVNYKDSSISINSDIFQAICPMNDSGKYQYSIYNHYESHHLFSDSLISHISIHTFKGKKQ
jgi:hypothetical protein